MKSIDHVCIWKSSECNFLPCITGVCIYPNSSGPAMCFLWPSVRMGRGHEEGYCRSGMSLVNNTLLSFHICFTWCKLECLRVMGRYTSDSMRLSYLVDTWIPTSIFLLSLILCIYASVTGRTLVPANLLMCNSTFHTTHTNVQIKVRKAQDIHSRSSLTILEADTHGYSAIIDKKVLMRIGGIDWTPPEGQWEMVTSGPGYMVWHKPRTLLPASIWMIT